MVAPAKHCLYRYLETKYICCQYVQQLITLCIIVKVLPDESLKLSDTLHHGEQYHNMHIKWITTLFMNQWQMYVDAILFAILTL